MTVSCRAPALPRPGCTRNTPTTSQRKTPASHTHMSFSSSQLFPLETVCAFDSPAARGCVQNLIQSREELLPRHGPFVLSSCDQVTPAAAVDEPLSISSEARLDALLPFESFHDVAAC